MTIRKIYKMHFGEFSFHANCYVKVMLKYHTVKLLYFFNHKNPLSFLLYHT